MGFFGTEKKQIPPALLFMLFRLFSNFCGDPFALGMLIVAAGRVECLISASQGELRPATLSAACAQRHKNLPHHGTCGMP